VILGEFVCCRLTDSGSEDPWVIQVALTPFNQENLKLMIKIGQSDKASVTVRKKH